MVTCLTHGALLGGGEGGEGGKLDVEGGGRGGVCGTKCIEEERVRRLLNIPRIGL